MRPARLFAVALLFTAAGTPTAPAAAQTAHPRAAVQQVDNTQVTLDTTGARMDAHDGTIVQDPAGTLWLVGTSYACGFRLNAPSPWCGVRVYRSTDLATWEPAGSVGGTLAFDSAAWQARCSGDHFGCFRPHIAMRPDGVWVMWLNVPSTPAGYAVLTAPAPGGPYAEQPAPRLAVASAGTRISYGDMDLTVQGGRAWLAYVVIGASNTPADIVVEELDPSWTSGRGHPTWAGRTHLAMAESPALWRSGGRWHLMYSDAAPYGITAAHELTAVRPTGPWWPTPGPVSERSCEGQSADVSELVSPSGVHRWVWQVDRWTQTGGRGDANQAQANTYLAPLAFNPDGTIPVQGCIPTWTMS